MPTGTIPNAALLNSSITINTEGGGGGPVPLGGSITLPVVSSPLTTKGDIWGFDTANDRIPVGADGDVLTADSTKPLGVKWAPGGGGSSGVGEYSTTWIGQTSVTVTHNLGSTSVIVQVFNAAGLQVIPETCTIEDSNTLTLTFGAAFTGSCTVIGGATGGVSAYSTFWTAQTSVTVMHDLGTTAVVVQVYSAAGLQVEPETCTVVDSNTVTLTFATAFSGSVVVVG